MGYKLTNVSTDGVITKGWYQGRQAKVLHQRVSVTDNAKQVNIGPKLPPQSRIVWASIVNHSAVAVDGNDGTNIANSFGLFNFGTATGPSTATASDSTSSAIVTVSTSLLASNSVTRKAVGLSTNDASAVYYNTTTSESLLCLLPMYSNSARIYAKTDGFLFNGTAEVDVTVYFEEFLDRYAAIH